MVYLILISALFTLILIIYYIRKRYIKEIFVALVLISISVLYLADFLQDINVPSLADIVDFVFKPVSELIFEIKK
ncbi:MAG TPA: hypothetical protein VIL05_06390 [Thermoclostridium sp.]